jgi:hypothetical protein
MGSQKKNIHCGIQKKIKNAVIANGALAMKQSRNDRRQFVAIPPAPTSYRDCFFAVSSQ